VPLEDYALNKPVGMEAFSTDRGQRTRERILAVAESLILRRGFAGTSLDDILAATGLTKGAFFHHFRGKADLADALVERYRQNHRALFERFASEADASADDPLEATLAFLQRFEAFIEARAKPLAGCLFAACTYQDGAFDARLRSVVANSFADWAKLYEARLGAVLACYEPKIEVTAPALAEMLLAIVEGGLILSRSLGDAHLVERVHPVEAGYLRRRVRTERRPGMPIEPAVIFYPKYWALTAVRQVRAGWLLLSLLYMAWSVRREERKKKYFDASMTPAVDDREAFDALEMIHTHGAAANALQRAHIHVHDEAHAEQRPLEAAE